MTGGVTKYYLTKLAWALKKSKPDNDPHLLFQWSLDVLTIADCLQGVNPRFDRSMFYQACTYDGDPNAYIRPQALDPHR